MYLRRSDYAKYDINKYSVETILSWVKNKEVVIPEIQRPFVWKAKQVRDLIDSLGMSRKVCKFFVRLNFHTFALGFGTWN